MADNTENFESLRRLMALKRHEVPPPGYFDKFSGQVASRLIAGDRGEVESFADRLFGEAPWLRRILQVLDARPLVAAGFGAGVCALLISGFVVAERADVADNSAGPSVYTASVRPPAERSPVAASDPLAMPVDFSSTNPVAPGAGALFDQMPMYAQPVSFGLPGK
jgi:hypothetical protein